MLSPEDGSFMSTIGPIAGPTTGYRITGLEYDATNDTLYGTSNSTDFLEIDMATGGATAITPGPGIVITRPTVDSYGFMVAWSPHATGDDVLVFVDQDTGETTEFPDYDIFFSEHGIAFDNHDILYIINSNGDVYTMVNNLPSLTGNIGSRAHHGDFHPETGHYSGIDNTNDSGGNPRHLLVVDVNTPAVMDSLATVDYLSAVTFYYD